MRKKAVMAMLRFHQLDSSSLASIMSKFQETLCDRDPAVMGATLNVYLALVSVSSFWMLRLKEQLLPMILCERATSPDCLKNKFSPSRNHRSTPSRLRSSHGLESLLLSLH